MDYRGFTEQAYLPHTGARKVLPFICNVLLSLYITFIVMMLGFADVFPNLGIVLVCGVIMFAAVYQLIKLCQIKLNTRGIFRHEQREKLDRRVFIPVAAAVFLLLLINLFAHYPGGISPDNLSQWEQAQSGVYTDWHPAIHTMLIWLITRINASYAFFIGVQILGFSLASGYMAATLAAWGIKKVWIVIFAVVLISTRTNGEILLFAWKDSAFTILLFYLAVQVINIVLSEGKWLAKYQNAVAFAVVAALSTIIRHNGLFFTVPAAALLLVFYVKTYKNVIIAITASVLIVAGVKLLLYPAAKVQYVPSQTYVESVGLPMTVLGGVMANNPQALDAETNEFLSRITDYQTWAETFESGNFNSIKYILPTTDVILSVTPGKLIDMTLRTITNAPKESLYEFIALTRIAWSPLDWQHNIEVYMEESARGGMVSETELDSMSQTKYTCETLYRNIRNAIELLTPSRILTSVGLQMLLLVLAGVYSVNRNLGGKALLLFVPSAVYNFGTMLLLFGPDYRFFHFNVVISLPLILALLAKPRVNSDYPVPVLIDCDEAAETE